MDFKDYEKVFGVFKSINDELIKKDNENHNALVFLDFFIFQATSYLMAIINDNILLKCNYITKIFLYRSLIECIAIMKMYFDDGISDENIELLKVYDFLAEYRMYNKYKEVLDDKQFSFSQIKTNYEETIAKYKEEFSNLNSKEFSKKINSRLPFLEENYNFNIIIKKYCSYLYDYYALFSICIHPNDLLVSSPIIKNLDFDKLESFMIDFVMSVAFEKYNYGEIKFTQNLSFELSMIEYPLNKTYLLYAQEQYNALLKFSELTIKEYGENTQSYFCIELANGILGMAYDKTFGLSEIIKVKFKPLVEMLSLNYYVATTQATEENYNLIQLITKYTNVQLMKFYKLDYSVALNEAYQIYNQSINIMSKEQFDEIFLKSLGFLPKKITISNFVYNFIDYIFQNEEVMKAHLKMVYDESQYLSHANGYMLSSNTGAFCEYSPVIVFIDRSIEVLLNCYVLIHKIYVETTGERRLNKLCYDLNKQVKFFARAAQKKNQFDFDHQDKNIDYVKL